MNQQAKVKRPNRLLIFFSVLLSIIIIDACRKIDSRLEKPKDANDPLVMADKFFTIPAGTHPTVKAIAESMRKQNDSLKFTTELIKNAGYPMWDKAKVLVNGGSNGLRTEGEEEPEDTTELYIPFGFTNQTSAILTVAINLFQDRDTAYNILYPSHYKNYSFDSTLPRQSWTARHVFQLFTEFDHEIFEKDTFLITDGRIFGQDETDSIYVRRTVPGGLGGNEGRNGLSTETVMVTVCINYLPVFFSENRMSTEVLMVMGPVNHCSNFWIQNGEDYSPMSPPNPSGGGGNPLGLGDLSNISECPIEARMVTEGPHSIYPCNPGWIPFSLNPFADYGNWGYHHFETWEVTQEDEIMAQDWAVNNIDTVGLDPCVRSILDDLLGGPSLIGRILTKMDRAAGRAPDAEKYHLKIQTGPLAQGLGAVSKGGYLNPVNNHYYDTITINNNGVLDSTTQVGMARNIVHEIIHTYMTSIFKRYYNIANPHLIPEDSIWNAYTDTLVAIHGRENLRGWYRSSSEAFDHNYMAERLLEIMAAALAIADDGRNSDEFYWSICWGGLFRTRPMKQAWPNYPDWPPTAGHPAPSNDSTRGLKYALTQARLDSIWRWNSRERYDTSKAKGRRRQSTGCYGN